MFCTPSIFIFSVVSCGEPMAGNNSWVMYNQTTFAENASYECNLGYGSDLGDATRTCGADREWSGDPLNCRRKSCIFACDCCSWGFNVLWGYDIYFAQLHVSS